MVKIFCVFFDDGVHTPFEVDIDDSLTVGHLKDAIHEDNPVRLAGVDAANLTIVRVFKEGVWGLTKEEVYASLDLIRSNKD
ncbi:hypothetical protein HDU99_005350, partial [Rhizoclosmatium hyalinum]